MTIEQEIINMLPTGWTATIIDRSNINYDIKDLTGFDITIINDLNKVIGYYGVDEDNRQLAMELILQDIKNN